MLEELARFFMSTFAGLDRAHGSYTLNSKKEGGKLVGKADTVHEKMTELKWLNHLKGVTRIGIIPINDQNKCRWGCIDIDTYPFDHSKLVKRVLELDLPLWVVRSKSGGCHLFCILTEPVDAAVMVNRLREFAAYLKYGSCEVFPKQTAISAERGDIGNWLNMPYFDCEKTMSYCFNSKGEAMSAQEFMGALTAKPTPPQQLIDFKLPEPKTEWFRDGPPCLQALMEQGVPEGARNTFLFNTVPYAKQKHPESWEEFIDKLNAALPNPLASSELQETVVKSGAKKEYNYQCKKSPLCDNCQVAVCRNREFGVGGGDKLRIENARQMLTTPSTWLLSMSDGTVLECTSEVLHTQRLFSILCLEVIRRPIATVKQADWLEYLETFTKDALVITVPEEVTGPGQLMELLERFCTGRVQANTKDEILVGKPWTNREEGRTFFKINSFLDFLKRSNFKVISQREVVVFMKQSPLLDAKTGGLHINGKYCRYWDIKAFGFQTEPFETKQLKEKTDEY